MHGLQFQEIGENLLADVAAFFGMELSTVEIFIFERRAEKSGAIAGGRDGVRTEIGII